MPHIINVVIIGFGHMHVNEISEYIAGQPEMKLLGAADVPLDLQEITAARYTRAWNMQNLKSKYGTPLFDDYRTMLDELKPEIAFILCDNANKPAVVAECASRGIDISIEKPLACTLDEALQIRDMVRNAGIQAVVNWPVIWRPYVQQFVAAVRSGICGKLVKLNYQNGHTGPLGVGAVHRGVAEAAEDMTDAQRARTWWYNRLYGGGASLDIGCYGCFFSQLVQTDKPVAASALAMNLNTPCANTEDHVAYMIRYPKSLTVAEGTWIAPGGSLPAGPVAFCDNGVIYCERAEGSLVVKAMDLYGKPVEVPPCDFPENMRNLPWNIAGHRLHGQQLNEAVNLEHNVRIMALLDTVIKASNEHREVAVPALDF